MTPIAYHVPNDARKITKSIGMANAWTEAGLDVQPLFDVRETSQEGQEMPLRRVLGAVTIRRTSTCQNCKDWPDTMLVGCAVCEAPFVVADAHHPHP